MLLVYIYQVIAEDLEQLKSTRGVKMLYLALLKKFTLPLMLLMMAVACWYFVSNIYYERGYDKSQAEYTIALNDQLIKSQEKFQKDVEKALIIQENDLKSSLVNSEQKIKIVVDTQKVIEYVDRKIEVPAVCNDVSSYVVGLLSKTTAIVSRATESSKQQDQ
jgi:hypothetical protein